MLNDLVIIFLRQVKDAAALGRPEQGTAPSGGSVLHEVKSVGVIFWSTMIGTSDCGR